MPSLRDYRDRIKSVKSTRKITSAMKMVAASKLRRAQEQAESSQPYAQAMSEMLARLAANTQDESGSKLLTGTGSDQKVLLIVVTADRGLCGGFNANIVKEARQTIRGLIKDDKEVSIVCVGRKGYDLLNREFGDKIVKKFNDAFGKKRVEYSQAHAIAQLVLDRFDMGEFDSCKIIYNEFKSVLVQTPQTPQLIPFQMEPLETVDGEQSGEDAVEEDSDLKLPYSFEPSEEEILDKLLPRNVGVQIYRAMLDSAAGEQAARMTAMDNATRNAGDMINDLTLQYNRARQAYITKELIEIISGAEAV